MVRRRRFWIRPVQVSVTIERLATIGRVAAMVGHDLRNPLQVVINTLYLAKRNMKSMQSQEIQYLKKYCETIAQQVDYMNKIVSDLHDYARPLKPELVETSLMQLINNALSIVNIPENIEVSMMIEEDFPKVMIDAVMMKRVFTNIILNAVQAMPGGGKLAIRAVKADRMASVSVEDTGVGIPKENMDKIFQPLFTSKSKGQGFGLAVCKRMVEAHSGNITVKSRLGKGSTLTIEIPIRSR